MPSIRRYHGLDELDYPFHDWTAVITTCGRICYQARKVNVSQVFAGQKVGVKQVEEHVWLVTFMHYDLGYFDDETCRLEPIDNPFGPSLLPMSPEITCYPSLRNRPKYFWSRRSDLNRGPADYELLPTPSETLKKFKRPERRARRGSLVTRRGRYAGRRRRRSSGKRAEDLPLDDTPVGCRRGEGLRRGCPSWPRFRQAVTMAELFLLVFAGARNRRYLQLWSGAA